MPRWIYRPAIGSEAEERYRLEPAVPPSSERLYDRRWAMTILERALKRLGDEYRQTQRGALFESIEGFLTSEPLSASYAQIATRLDVREGALKTASGHPGESPSARRRSPSHDARRRRVEYVTDEPSPTMSIMKM
jgi:hypothetical protein